MKSKPRDVGRMYREVIEIADRCLHDGGVQLGLDWAVKSDSLLAHPQVKSL